MSSASVPDVGVFIMIVDWPSTTEGMGPYTKSWYGWGVLKLVVWISTSWNTTSLNTQKMSRARVIYTHKSSNSYNIYVYIYIYMYIDIYVYVYLSLYIYIYIERERDVCDTTRSQSGTDFSWSWQWSWGENEVTTRRALNHTNNTRENDKQDVTQLSPGSHSS